MHRELFLDVVNAFLRVFEIKLQKHPQINSKTVTTSINDKVNHCSEGKIQKQDVPNN